MCAYILHYIPHFPITTYCSISITILPILIREEHASHSWEEKVDHFGSSWRSDCLIKGLKFILLTVKLPCNYLFLAIISFLSSILFHILVAFFLKKFFFYMLFGTLVNGLVCLCSSICIMSCPSYLHWCIDTKKHFDDNSLTFWLFVV